MKVIVLGASGFIGLPVAQALSRAGHVVYGVTRSENKAKLLAAEEIIPIVADYSDPSPWLGHIPTLDAIIDTVGGTADLRTFSGALVDNVVSAVRAHRPQGCAKLTFIATSGTWVHGENRNEVVTDTTPITNPAEVVAWRPALEQRVVSEPSFNGIVIRPSLLYGKSASLFAPLFQLASEGKVAWYGTPGGRYATVHCDDLADVYVRAAERGQLVRGNIFDATNSQTDSVDDFLTKLVEVSGAQGPFEYLKPNNAYEVALTTTTLIRPYLAKALLDWTPKKAGLVDGLSTWYSAWLATQETKGAKTE
ncbi:hypothetical protein HYDPIDRAFT_176373 [Hydnomerulius pinastri MD-312]|uniref:NAD-dependent epimerase/dehydratase domain-containing protein n=1 Tax=Hydnomerulius pinastri MD-312 TaxID=994086 RepID=A0A0C9VWJ4_9AGAM|nr:hypothetical protein HYDPIDRAFT_176373 [Hydnomerulius pinastri MD-312]